MKAAKKVVVKSWQHRLVRRWADGTQFFYEDVPWWFQAVSFVLSAYLFACGVATLEGVFCKDFTPELKIMLVCLMPAEAAIMAAMLGIAAYPSVIRSARGRLRKQLALYFGTEVASATKDFGWDRFQPTIDAKLRDLAVAFQTAVVRGDHVTARCAKKAFWAAHNVAWAFGFDVEPTITAYFPARKEARSC